MSFPKTVYITSRGGTVPVRKRYMDSIGADYAFIDHKIRWHDVQASFFKKVLSWFVSAITFPNRKKYTVFISSGQHYMPVIMKKLGLLRNNQKIVCYQGNETLYFLKAGRYSKWSERALKWQLRQYDYHLCLSKLQSELLTDVVGDNGIQKVMHFNGVEAYRLPSLLEVKPNLNSKNILFIGNLYSGWRLWYKGIDVLVETVSILHNQNSEITCTIVGEIQEEALVYIKARCDEGVYACFKFAGKQKDLSKYFAESLIYLHLSRGEAFGSVVIEAMAAGLIPIVSDVTGAKEAVEQIDKSLIVPLDPGVAANKVTDIFGWTLQKKGGYSTSCKNLIKDKYTEEDAIKNFQKIITEIAAS